MLWLSWGVHPQAMLGQSLGEYTAACLAGVLTCEDALHLIALRGALMQKMPAGAMLSVALSAAATQARLLPGVEIAACNAEDVTVVCGPGDLLSAWQHQLHADGVLCQRLHVSRAFHSALLDPMIPAFVEALQNVELHAPRMPYISCLTGNWITPDQATDPAYWGLQVRQPVQFLRGLHTLQTGLPGALLEVGAGSALSRLACRQQSTLPSDQQIAVIASLSHLDETRSERTALLDAVGRLWLAGVSLNWQALAGPDWRRVRLPGYPFERRYRSSGAPALASFRLPGQPETENAPPPVPPVPHVPASGLSLAAEQMQESEIEQIIIEIWRDLIGISEIGGETDFFLSGGDSLVAGLVIARLTACLGKEVPLHFVFEFSTVATFAADVEEFLLADMQA
jgi:phthiocerol/phenolphthiocerol synthesis type-I polyketide synthase E